MKEFYEKNLTGSYFGSFIVNAVIGAVMLFLADPETGGNN